jgi:hypothetical protein
MPVTPWATVSGKVNSGQPGGIPPRRCEWDQELALRVDDAGPLRDPCPGCGHHLDHPSAGDPHHLVTDQPPFNDVDDGDVTKGYVVCAGWHYADQN